MAQFILRAVKTDENPAFMKVGGFGGSACVDQHRGGLTAVGLDANPINAVAKTGKHLAANLPAIKLGWRISSSGTGMGGAKCVDVITGHGSRVAHVAEAGKMTKYAGFLRGINVGGHRKIPMPDLRRLIIGKTSDPRARTYINSGNVVFASDRDKAALTTKLRTGIQEEFGLDVPVLLLTDDELVAVLASCPAPAAAGNLVYAYLCFDPPQMNKAELDGLQAASETVRVVGRTVWLVAPDGVGRSKLAAKMEKLTGVQVTARNLNTLRKMVEMLDR